MENINEGIVLKEQERNGTFYLLAFVVVLWGINVVMIKYLTTFYPPLALAPIRIFLATCLLLPIVIRRYGLFKIPRKLFFFMFGVAFFSIFIHHILLSWGVSITSATHAALILGLNPLITSVLASRFVGEQLSFSKLLGICIGFLGVLLVVAGREETAATFIGDGFMFLAMMAAVIGSLFIKKCTEDIPVLVITAYTHAAASAGLLIFGCFVNTSWYSSADAFSFYPLSILFFSSFINTAMGAWWWNTGIQKIGASKSSLFQNGIPVFGVLASAVFLGEPFGWMQILALLFVCLGVILGTRNHLNIFAKKTIEK